MRFIIMNYCKKTLLLIIGLLLCVSPYIAHAQWYETQGHARLDKNTVEIARTKAMENALKKALLIAGASVSSVQQVINGLLTQDQLDIRATGSVNSIELVDEMYNGDLITVTIRADIFPQERKCFAVNFKKSLLITKSNIMHRQQANIGKIYAIDKAVPQQLSKQLSEHSSYTTHSNILNNKTQFSRLNNSLANDKIAELSKTLAHSSNSQYVLFSEIHDISFEQEATNNWQFWQQGIYPRNFAVSFYLYSGINGELMWQNEYQSSAPWEFSKRLTIDPYSIKFWQSEYGTMINGLLEKVVKNIDENIMCEPSRGNIIQLTGNQITFDLGRQHGVKIGDEFTILQRHNFSSNDGKNYTGFNASPYKVKVTQLTQNTAIARTPDGNLFGNIQVDDLVVRY